MTSQISNLFAMAKVAATTRKALKLLIIGLLVSSACYAKSTWNIAQKSTEGVASYYGRREQGKRTASGERFNMRAYTCASRYYKLGTLLMVTYPAKGTFVVVRVNDRGPWVHGRVIDLSEKAATVLGLKPQGLGHVEIEPVHIWRTQ